MRPFLLFDLNSNIEMIVSCQVTRGSANGSSCLFNAWSIEWKNHDESRNHCLRVLSHALCPSDHGLRVFNHVLGVATGVSLLMCGCVCRCVHVVCLTDMVSGQTVTADSIRERKVKRGKWHAFKHSHKSRLAVLLPWRRPTDPTKDESGVFTPQLPS